MNRIAKHEKLRQRVLAQRKWIHEHGSNPAGYVTRYGDPGADRCYGNGGTAIWKADLAALIKLEAAYTAATGRTS